MAYIRNLGELGGRDCEKPGDPDCPWDKEYYWKPCAAYWWQDNRQKACYQADAGWTKESLAEEKRGVDARREAVDARIKRAKEAKISEAKDRTAGLVSARDIMKETIAQSKSTKKTKTIAIVVGAAIVLLGVGSFFLRQPAY